MERSVSFFLGFDYSINNFLTGGFLIRSKNNGVQQLMFLEPYVTLRPLHNTSVTLANFMQKDSPFNPKLTIQAELASTFGLNLSIIYPWRIGKYYDTKMIHASLGMYLKFWRG